jgi:predicted MPP superfamily phosphohydrolase
VRIAVAHAPEGVPFIAGRGAQLLLCGHTHGGQVALPSGPVVVHGRLGRRWPSGLHDVAGMKLFVSRGLGIVDLPLRLYAAPDVSLFTLT